MKNIIMVTGQPRRYIIKHVRKCRTLQRKAERNQKHLDRKIWEALYA